MFLFYSFVWFFFHHFFFPPTFFSVLVLQLPKKTVHVLSVHTIIWKNFGKIRKNNNSSSSNSSLIPWVPPWSPLTLTPWTLHVPGSPQLVLVCSLVCYHRSRSWPLYTCCCHGDDLASRTFYFSPLLFFFIICDYFRSLLSFACCGVGNVFLVVFSPALWFKFLFCFVCLLLTNKYVVIVCVLDVVSTSVLVSHML